MSNRTWRLSAVVIGLAATCGLLLAEEAETGLLKLGSQIPGSFQTLSVTLPPTVLKPIPQAGRFHCPVCEYRLNPAVLIFARQLDPADAAPQSQPLTSLLKKLDAVIGQHPDARVGACAVFNDGGYLKFLLADLDETTSVTLPVKEAEFTKAIEFKETMEAKLKNFAKAADFKHIALSLGSPDAYPIPANADSRVLFYYKHQVISDEAFPRDKLTDAAIDQFVKSVAEKATEVDKENRANTR